MLRRLLFLLNQYFLQILVQYCSLGSGGRKTAGDINLEFGNLEDKSELLWTLKRSDKFVHVSTVPSGPGDLVAADSTCVFGLNLTSGQIP